MEFVELLKCYYLCFRKSFGGYMKDGWIDVGGDEIGVEFILMLFWGKFKLL